MSFDVFLQRFEDRKPAEVDRRLVLDVLRTTAFRGPDAFGFYVVAFPDGVDVEFSARGLESDDPFSGCAFHVRGCGDSLIAFMFEVARAGDMVILPAMEGNPIVLVSEAQEAHLPLDIGDDVEPICVRAPSDLAAVLTG